MEREIEICWINKINGMVMFDAILSDESNIPTVGSFDDFSMEGEKPNLFMVSKVERQDGGHVNVLMEKVVAFNMN